MNSEVKAILEEQFAKDCLISLATVENDMPQVRIVDAYYEDGSFYVITYALSNKMRQLAKNPAAAVCCEWFTGRGVGENLGWFQAPENARMAEILRRVFAAWIDNGHNDFSDQNTCILRIRLESGVLFAHENRYDIDFTARD